MGEFEISLTFEEWQKKKGEKSWWEVAVLVDYSVASYNDIIKRAVNEMSYALTKKLWEGGSALAPPELTVVKEPLDFAWRINANVATEYECLPEQYLYFTYYNWKYTEMEWENKTLWGYLKHWLKRKFRVAR